MHFICYREDGLKAKSVAQMASTFSRVNPSSFVSIVKVSGVTWNLRNGCMFSRFDSENLESSAFCIISYKKRYFEEYNCSAMLLGVSFCREAADGISPCGVGSFGCSLILEGLQNEVLMFWSQLLDVFQEVWI